MSEKIQSKRQMYNLLRSGKLGNTNLAWYNLEQWRQSSESTLYPLWGIRSMSVADRRLSLDVPTDRVEEVIAANFRSGFNLSPMVDQWTFFRGEVWDSPTGLRVYGVFHHLELKWREAVNRYGQEWIGLAAHCLLEQVLWPSDLADLDVLLEQYPSHVIEYSCCTRAVGTLPHRNGIVWECRTDTGEYEKWI